jgi:hypothetical protein
VTIIDAERRIPAIHLLQSPFQSRDDGVADEVRVELRRAAMPSGACPKSRFGSADAAGIDI